MDNESLSGGVGYPVELYHEFLNLMGQTDYSDNQIVFNPSSSTETPNSNPKPTHPNPKQTTPMDSKGIIRTKSRSINNLKQPEPQMPFPNSYPPMTDSKLWHDHRLSVLRLDGPKSSLPVGQKSQASPKISPTSSHSSNYNEFINVNDFNIPLDLTHHYDLSLDDNLSILSYDDEEDEENYNLLQQFVSQTCDSESNSDSGPNPLVPGLFPKMDINDEDNFLKFDKLPLNPSYIVNSNDTL